MQAGRFTIEQLTEGRFEFFDDRKINRAAVGEQQSPGTLANSSRSDIRGINPLYVTDGTYHVLLDTGLGWGLDAGSGYTDVSNVVTNLEIFGVSPGQITHIVLSHLHYDHAAGVSYVDNSARTEPVFPNAECYIQRSEWEFAVEKVQQHSGQIHPYQLDELYRLYSNHYFTFLEDSEKEIIPGITAIRTGGHTPGHQIIRIEDGGTIAYHAGDLLVNGKLVNRPDAPQEDNDPVKAKNERITFLRKAHAEDACIYFYHSLSAKPCRLQVDRNENYILQEVEQA